MSILQKFLNSFRRKSTDVTALIDSNGKLRLHGGMSYGSLVDEGYKRNFAVYVAIQKIATCACYVPWCLYRRTSDQPEEIKNHPLLNMIRNPNPKEDQTKFFSDLFTYWLISGSAYVYGATGLGQVRMLQNIKPDTIYKDPANPNRWVRHGPKGPETLKEEEILWISFLDPSDSSKGLSPLVPAALAIDSGNSSREWNAKLLSGGARPPGILKAKYGLDEAMRDSYISTFIEKYGGSGNAGTVPLLQGDIDFIPTGMAPAEMEWLKGQILADRNAAVTMGVPPQLLGDREASTYANYAEARKAFYEERVIPLLRIVVSCFNAWLVRPQDENLYFELDLDDVPALQENRKETFDRLNVADWLKIDEKREASGYEALGNDAGQMIITSKGVVILADGTVVMAGKVPPPEEEEAAPGQEEAPGSPKKPLPEEEEEEEEEEKPEEEAAKQFFFLLKGDKVDKVAYWKLFDRARSHYESAAQVLIQREFQEERIDIVKSIRKLSSVEEAEPMLGTYLDSRYDNWEKVYNKIYLLTGEGFIRRVWSQLPKGWLYDLEAKGIRELIDFWQAEAVRIVKTLSAKIVGIAKSTEKSLRGQLALGIEKGEGIDEIARRVDRYALEHIIPNRSEVIARTEVVSASNAAADSAAKETRLVLNKEWIATKDSRTRDTHADVDGMKVKMEEAFLVGGHRMLYPGDSSMGAPAEEVINCRCATGYTPV